MDLLSIVAIYSRILDIYPPIKLLTADNPLTTSAPWMGMIVPQILGYDCICQKVGRGAMALLLNPDLSSSSRRVKSI